MPLLSLLNHCYKPEHHSPCRSPRPRPRLSRKNSPFSSLANGSPIDIGSRTNHRPLIDLYATIPSFTDTPKPFPYLPDSLTQFHASQLLSTFLRLRSVTPLAEGYFGSVFSAQTSQSQLFAVKVYLFGRSWNTENRLFDFRWSSFQADVTVLQQVKHGNIIRFYSPFQIYSETDNCELENGSLKIVKHEQRDPNKPLLMAGFFMEKLDLNLRQWMEMLHLDRLNESQILLTFTQIGSALRYLHKEHFICHQDLKAANIGVKQTPNGAFPKLVLLDFGNAAIYSKAVYQKAELQSVCGGNTDLLGGHVPQTFRLLPAGRNPFLLEAFHFSRLLLSLATFDLGSQDIASIWNSFTRNCAFEKEPKFKPTLLRMIQREEEDQVTINWAMTQMFEV